MVVISKSHCDPCYRVKEMFDKTTRIEELSERFVMVNLFPEEVPSEDFKPDGDYTPRIIFLDSNGNVRKDVYNLFGDSKYKYFYRTINEIVVGMIEGHRSLQMKEEL